jgi:hypothetical protein
MAYTHFDALSAKNGGYAVGAKGSETVVIDASRNISAKRISTAVSVLTAGSTVTLNCALGDVFTLTPGQAETINASNISAGQRVNLVVTTSGTDSYTLTFNTNFKTTGTLATGATSGKVFVVAFVSDGTNLNEVARTTAM